MCIMCMCMLSMTQAQHMGAAAAVWHLSLNSTHNALQMAAPPAPSRPMPSRTPSRPSRRLAQKACCANAWLHTQCCRAVQQSRSCLSCAVIGVSSDDVASHVEFRNKLDLPFPLLADQGGQVCLLALEQSLKV